jgi:hypothetical protein
MIIKPKPNKRQAECPAVRRVSDDHEVEHCLAPTHFLTIQSTDIVVLCRAHASALFLALKKDLGQ